MFNNICDKTIYVWCRDGSVQKIYKYGKKCKGIQGWLCQKPQQLGVEMAVCRQDMLYIDYTSNSIPTSFFKPDITLCAML